MNRNRVICFAGAMFLAVAAMPHALAAQGFMGFSVKQPFDYCVQKTYGAPFDTLRIAAPETGAANEGGIPVHASVVTLNSGETGYRIVLIPVGFPDSAIPRQMDGLVSVLSRAFPGVDVSFSYLTTSMPFTLIWGGGGAGLYLADSAREHIADSLVNALRRLDPLVRGVALVVNRSDHLGGWWHLPVFTGKSPASYVLAIHEIAHHLGLDDGYERYYGTEYLSGSELFVSLDSLPPEVHEAYLAIQPPYKSVGNNCNGRPVYAFSPRTNIMRDGMPTNAEVMRSIEAGESLFTDFQIWIMAHRVNAALGRP